MRNHSSRNAQINESTSHLNTPSSTQVKRAHIDSTFFRANSSQHRCTSPQRRHGQLDDTISSQQDSDLKK